MFIILFRILLILAFIFVTWIVWENKYGNERFIKKYTAKQKRDQELIRTRTDKGKRKARQEQINVDVGPATIAAGAAFLHHHREVDHQQVEPIDPYKEDLGLYDDSLDNLYEMDRSESLEFFGDTQSYDNADYDDYLASIDDDY